MAYLVCLSPSGLGLTNKRRILMKEQKKKDYVDIYIDAMNKLYYYFLKLEEKK